MTKRKPTYINKRGETVDLDLTDGDLVPDGFGIRISSFLMDGDPVQREIASRGVRVSDATMVTDAFGRKAGSRPGYCYGPSTRSNEVQARDAYAEMVKRNENAWRGSNVISDQTMNDPEAAREAYIKRTEKAWCAPPNNNVQARDACNGHVTFPGGNQTQGELDAAREQAYEEMVRKNENAWRTPRSVGFGPGSFGG